MNKKKIMVIDDEESFLHLVKMNLEETNRYEVLTISDAAEAVSHLNKFRPDVILLDMIMPGVGGLDVCEMLNKDFMGKKTPIIMLSALDKDIDQLMAYKKGIVDYLTKPVDIDKLVRHIEKALEYK